MGLGLMGGSMALALRGKCKMIYGVDTDNRTLSYALENNIIDFGARSIEEITPDYEVVILAVPVTGIIQALKRFPGILPPGVLVLDLGSTKEEIVHHMNQLPEIYFAVGGHPICGREHSSIFYSQSDLYIDASFILVKTARTSNHSEILLTNLVNSIGAKPVWLNAHIHDKIFAMTSHLPYLVSNALASAIEDPETLLYGPGFKSTIRMAGSDVEMFLDILITNKKNVLEMLKAYSTIIRNIEILLETGQLDTLRSLLLHGKHNYFSIYRDDKSG